MCEVRERHRGMSAAEVAKHGDVAAVFASLVRIRRTRVRVIEPTPTAHCGYLSGVMGVPEGRADVTVLSGAEAALAGLYAARRGV